jgi:RecB family exonuclease
MTTSTVAEQEEARLYDELRRALEEVEEGEKRHNMLKQMIRQIKFARWRKERFHRFNRYVQGVKPATLWIMLATGALMPVVLFSVFIWVSLWVE